MIPPGYIQIAAALSFICVVFHLFRFLVHARGDTLHKEETRFHVNPFWTIALTIFLAETGDKPS